MRYEVWGKHMRLQLLDKPTREALHVMRSEFTIVKKDPDIIYTQLTPVTCNVPVFCPCTGVGHISSHKIVNLYDKQWLEWNVFGTAEHTLALILFAFKNLGYHCMSGAPVRTEHTPMSKELHGRRALIVGYGRVGRQVSRLLHAFGMNVDTIEQGELPSLITDKLNRADVITFHIPLEGNEGTVDNTWFMQMKKGAVVVNTSRGGIFDDTAVGRWSKRLVFCLDTCEGYDEDVLQTVVDNGGLITSHVGGLSDRSREATDMWIVERMLEWKAKHK
jgi:lactate dehydrogenase-like 2-hydroxyacid dehydrogenase